MASLTNPPCYEGLPDGDYYIFNAATAKCIDVDGAQLLKENAVVQTYSCLRNNAQVFQVRNSGGKVYITSRLYGNRFGPVSNASNAAVKLNVKATGVDTNIKWTVVDILSYGVADTINHGGKYYAKFNLKYGNYYLYSAGADKSPLMMSSSTSTNSQWYFVPIVDIDEGGLYEIRPSIATGMAIDIDSAASYNGNNVRIWTANGTNAQKFYVDKKSGTTYTIRNIATGKYVDVDSAANKSGTNVHIWEKNDTRAQDWRVLVYGRTTLNGATCPIVSFGSLVDGSGSNLMMDVMNAGKTIGTNLQIFTMNNTEAQRFLLYPTTAEDANMPVPHTLGTSNGAYGTRKTYGYTTDNSFLTWHCSASWCSDNGGNHYELRYRTRTMNSLTSSWNAWSGWSAWTIPAIMTSGQAVWAYAEDVLGEYAWNNAKNQQIELELRSVGANELASLHSKSITQTINIFRKPVIDITRAGWTPGGILMEFTSDYKYGTTYLMIDSIKCDNKEVLKAPVEISGRGGTLSELIDRDKCSAFIADGAQLKITYRVGYDQQRVCDGTFTDTISCIYDAGSVNVEPDFYESGAHLLAYVPHIGEERMWVSYKDKIAECINPTIETKSGKTYSVFDVLYPTDGSEFDVFTEARSSDGSKWGTDVSRVKFKHTSYAWTTDDGTVYLNKFIDELPTYSTNNTANYQVDNLDSRKYSTVSFAPNITSELTAYGVLLTGDDSADNVEDFEKLTGQHAVFRDIFGGIHNVAVTNVSVNKVKDYYAINITMIEESI